MEEQKPQNPSQGGARKLINEEVFDFFKTLAQCVIDNGGMTVADVEAISLNEAGSFDGSILYAYWKSSLSDARLVHDTLALSQSWGGVPPEEKKE